MKLPGHVTLAPRILKDFFFFKKSANWSKEQVRTYQNKKLIEIVQYAGKYVPYYRNLFKDINFDIKKFKGIEDLFKIPYLDKEILRIKPDEFVSDVYPKNKVIIEKTSGSTGTPLRLHIDEISRSRKYAAFARAYFWSGYKPGALRFVLKGFSESKKEPYGYDLLRNMIYLNSSKMTKDNCLSVLALLRNKKINIFEGYARSFIDFYNIVGEHNMDIKPPKGILCYGETITSEMRVFVETKYKTRLFDFYSHAENSVMICQRPDNKKYLMEDYFYPEIINGTGSISSSGYGELVGTSFYNYAMPLIRYKTRDNIKLNLDNISSPNREVLGIEGRMDDFILLPDGRKIYFAKGAIYYAVGVVAAQYIQNDKRNLMIKLIVDDRFRIENISEIEKGLVKRIGNELTIDFQIVDHLEKKKSGKTPFIINNIGKLDEKK